MQPLPDAQPGVTYVDAGRLQSEGEITTFSGGVEVQRDQRLLAGEQMRYNRQGDILTIDGDVVYRTGGMTLFGDRAEVRLEQDQGEVNDVRFFIAESHGYGQAERVDIITPEFTSMRDVTYSTCPPQQRDWELRSRELELDEAENTGEAYDVTVRFKGVPLFYTPYLNFPLQGRKSGLLAPAIGTSETGGNDVSVPYYWNIAPNRDATFTPRWIENRGTMLYTEHRYLFRHSSGQFNYDYLPDDELFGDDRHFTSLHHTQALTPRFHAYAVYNRVSDASFFDDLSASQSRTSQTHLERRLDLTYGGDNWSMLLRGQGYQALTGAEPYQRLPQVLVNAAMPSAGALSYAMQAELVRFVHETRDPTGTRLDLTPSASLPLEGVAWFLTPRLAVRHTQYRLEEAEEETRRRTVPVTSIDSGLFFERELSLGGRTLLQTLEPRLFYLYVPYRSQDDLPVFDTGRYDFSFAQLFREDRFTGADRVGDANQLTTAVTTRFIDATTGAELATASLGQIQYFRDRRVQLSPTIPDETLDSSDLVGELTARPGGGFDLSAGARWNPHEDQTELFTSRVRYRPAAGKALALSYREREPEQLRQTDLAFFWPLTSHWNTLGRWNYDLETEQDLDTIFGLEYQSCCWALRAVKRSTLNTSTLQLEHSFLMTLELKGLAQIGDRLDAELERGILGYD